jgi:hypothetical protein
VEVLEAEEVQEVVFQYVVWVLPEVWEALEEVQEVWEALVEEVTLWQWVMPSHVLMVNVLVTCPVSVLLLLEALVDNREALEEADLDKVVMDSNKAASVEAVEEALVEVYQPVVMEEVTWAEASVEVVEVHQQVEVLAQLKHSLLMDKL